VKISSRIVEHGHLITSCLSHCETALVSSLFGTFTFIHYDTLWM